MAFIFKKPSDLLQVPIPVDYIYPSAYNNGIATICPNCRLEHEYIHDWPVDIPIICDDKECKCRFIISNNTIIED